MLFDRLVSDEKTKDEKRRFLEDMTGEPRAHDIFPSRLPNIRESTEKEFWSYQSSMRARFNIWFGSDKFVRADTGNLTPCTVMGFYYNSPSMPKEGFLVAYFHEYGNERTQYYRFGACLHDWNEHSPRMCYHVVTCSKCKATYDYHSD